MAAESSCAAAGFLLNDEMNDFAWHPGITDTHGHHRHSAESDRARQTDAEFDVPHHRARKTESPI